MDPLPEKIFDVMNCELLLSLDDLPRGQYRMEPKLDGFRLTAEITEKGTHLRTRSKKVQDGKLPHVSTELHDIFPPGTVLDGEIVAMTFEGERIINDFEYVQSIMLSGAGEAVRKQTANRWLKYIVFDMLHLGDLDIRHEPYEARTKALNAALGASGAVHVAAMQTWPASQEIHDALVKNGFEGTVVKNTQGKYLSGIRGGKLWFKMKHSPTVDVVVLGQGKPGEGKNRGLVGSIRFGQPMREEDMESLQLRLQKRQRDLWHEIDGVTYLERGQCGGMDDEERVYVTEHLAELVGTTIEIAHFGIFPGGVTMRMPQFKRFRPDKPAKDVTWHNSG